MRTVLQAEGILHNDDEVAHEEGMSGAEGTSHLGNVARAEGILQNDDKVALEEGIVQNVEDDNDEGIKVEEAVSPSGSLARAGSSRLPRRSGVGVSPKAPGATAA